MAHGNKVHQNLLVVLLYELLHFNNNTSNNLQFDFSKSTNVADQPKNWVMLLCS